MTGYKDKLIIVPWNMSKQSEYQEPIYTILL